MSKTIFQKIIDREIPASIVYEDEQVLAFRDINAQARNASDCSEEKHLANC